MHVLVGLATRLDHPPPNCLAKNVELNRLEVTAVGAETETLVRVY